jgi:hypothetical protein
MRRALMFVVLAGSLSGWGVAVAEEASDGATDNGRIRVERDPETFLTKVRIRASHENEVAWVDVFRGLARARGYDDTALADLPRKGKFSITGPAWLLTAAGLNRALGPAIQFGVEPGETQTAEPWLAVQMDRAALLASQRRFNKLFAVKRGRLDGVEDTIVLDFGHTRVLERVSGADVQEVQDGVFERLQRKDH